MASWCLRRRALLRHECQLCWRHIETQDHFELRHQPRSLVLGDLVEVWLSPVDGRQLIDRRQPQQIPFRCALLERDQEPALLIVFEIAYQAK